MPPKSETAKQLDDLLSRIEELERRESENLKKIEKLEVDNGILVERIKALEEKKTDGVLDWGRLFDKKGIKSTQEIKLTQGIIELNKDASKRDKNVIIIGIQNSNDSDPSNRKKFDEDIVQELFREININPSHIKRVHRFKSKEDSSRSI